MLTDPPADQIRTRSDVAAVAAGCRWSRLAIARKLRFARSLRDPRDRTRPYRLLTWQRELLYKLEGWRRPDGRRRFTQLHVWIPKKNGKTSFLAELNLDGLLNDREPQPGCYVVATSANQSEELYKEAKRLLGWGPVPEPEHYSIWYPCVRMLDYKKTLKSRLAEGEFVAMGSAADASEGAKGSRVTFDEAHVSLRKHPDLYDSLRYAGTGKRMPLLTVISTAGSDRKSLPHEIYLHDKRILAGEVVDWETLAVIYEAPDKESYTPAELAAANPGVGEVMELSQLVADYNGARVKPHEFRAFKRRRLNVWTKGSSAWLDAAKWIALARPELDWRKALRGRRVFVGVDLSSVLDLTTAVAVFQDANGFWGFFGHFWLPDVGIDDRCEKEIDYRAAAAGGYMTLCQNPKVDYGSVRQWITDLRDVHGAIVPTIGFDRARAAELAQDLTTLGGFDCVAVQQGRLMNEPCKKFEALIATGECYHDGNPVLSFCVENVEVACSNNHIFPVKPSDITKRIDGVVGCLNGLFPAMFDGVAAASQTHAVQDQEAIEEIYGEDDE